MVIYNPPKPVGIRPGTVNKLPSKIDFAEVFMIA